MTNPIGLGPHSPIVLLMVSPPVRLRGESTLAVASRVMQDAQASYALIGGQGAGIGTRRALLRALAAGVDPETRLSTIAAAESVTVDGETSIVGAACEMLRQDVPHVAVAFRGEPVGILTLREVMAVLLEVFDTEDWMRALRVAVVSPSGPSLTLRPV